MRGVDFSSANNIGGQRNRFSLLENMYCDYGGEGEGITESVPGFRKILSLGERINGFYLQALSPNEKYVVVHAGRNLYRFNLNDRDSLNALAPIKKLCDVKSHGFAYGDSIYILDGEKITRVDRNGNASFVLDGSEAHAYIPTTRLNGKEYEQRNLLTDIFYEEYFVALPDEVANESRGLKYKITDTENRKCALVGVDSGFSGNLYVPSYTVIGSERYSVEGISDFAFVGNSEILSVTVAEGVKTVSSYSFNSCSSLEKVILPDSVSVIGSFAFSGCSQLYELRLGSAISSIGGSAFKDCAALTSVKYALDAASFSKIENSTELSSKTLVTGSKLETMRARIPVFTEAEMISEVYVDGVETAFVSDIVNGTVTGVIITKIEKSLLVGATVKVKGYASNGLSTSKSLFAKSFISELPSGTTAAEAIYHCTVCECFDERIFLSGNPDFPNTVFYSSRDNSGNNNPLYYGVFNYFNDGLGSFPVTSVLAAGDSLAVFKGGDDGSGSIFYHTPKETGIDILPKIYPTSYVHSGISATGATISFFDDPLFVSQIGICALDKKAINMQRSIACRSHNVNAKLLTENPNDISLAVWCGYLAVSSGGRIYLANSRSRFTHESGNTEYEWYYLNGVGTYKDDEYVYRWAESAKEGYYVHPQSGEITDKTVYSVVLNDGTTLYYATDSEKRYAVRKTEEKQGGVFSPATILFSVGGELLFFGTESGDVCVFNNDMRGVAPKSVASQSGFNPSAYAELMGRKLHPEFYLFSGHLPHYCAATVFDDCSIPYFTKNTVKNSLTLKMMAYGGGELYCRSECDVNDGFLEKIKLPSPSFDFSDFDFSYVGFYDENKYTIAVREKEKGWLEKQVAVYSDGMPFGIYSVSYRFTIKGKIKSNKI